MEQAKLLETASGLEHTMDRLTALLTDESEGVYTRNTADLGRIQSEKAQLFADYVTGLQTLRDSSNGQSAVLPEAVKTSLRDKYPLLAAAMKQNLRALAVAMEASQRVIGMIVNAVQEQRSAGAGYGVSRSGAVTGSPAASGSAQAITLDTRL